MKTVNHHFRTIVTAGDSSWNHQRMLNLVCRLPTEEQEFWPQDALHKTAFNHQGENGHSVEQRADQEPRGPGDTGYVTCP